MCKISNNTIKINLLGNVRLNDLAMSECVSLTRLALLGQQVEFVT